MDKKDIALIVATHKKYWMPSDDMYIPIHVGKEGKDVTIVDMLPSDKLYKNLNHQLVSMEALTDKADIERVKSIIEKHVALTGYVKGKKVLDNFDSYIGSFKKIIPADYKQIMSLIEKNTSKGLSKEEAQIKACTDLIGSK